MDAGLASRVVSDDELDEAGFELARHVAEVPIHRLAVIKQAARKRVEIKQAALSPTVSSARIQQMQNDIFRLQREILEYKLSCRDSVVRTFNNENWDSFFMVLAGEDIGVSVPVNFSEK